MADQLTAADFVAPPAPLADAKGKSGKLSTCRRTEARRLRPSFYLRRSSFQTRCARRASI
jgi:hypothetical protein